MYRHHINVIKLFVYDLKYFKHIPLYLTDFDGSIVSIKIIANPLSVLREWCVLHKCLQCKIKVKITCIFS